MYFKNRVKSIRYKVHQQFHILAASYPVACVLFEVWTLVVLSTSVTSLKSIVFSHGTPTRILVGEVGVLPEKK